MEYRDEDRRNFSERSDDSRGDRRGEFRRQERRFDSERKFERRFDGERRFERRDGRGFSGERRFEPRGENGFKRDGFKKDGFRPRPEKFSRAHEIDSIMDMDTDILHLVMRRAKALSHLKSKGSVSAEAEKQIRTAWENKAAKLARDPRVSRDLFLLLQSVEPLSPVEEDHGYFNLSPNTEPVDVNLPAPTDSCLARLWLSFAAASGKQCSIPRVPMTNSVFALIKAYKQMGPNIWWEDDGTIKNNSGSGFMRNMDKVIFIGDDMLNFWLVMAFCAGMPTRLKIMGDSALRSVDLSALRRFLPTLGIRMTNAIPSQEGLPVRVECSGAIPSEIVFDEDLPDQFISAMLLASPFWENKCSFVLPAREPALMAEVENILTSCGASVERDGRKISIIAENLDVPEEPEVGMDATLSAMLLMLPGFNGGQSVLNGFWGSSRAHRLVRTMLLDAGLALKFGVHTVTCTGKEKETTAPKSETIKTIADTCPNLLPLAVLLCAAAVYEGAEVALPELSEYDKTTSLDFLARLGIEEKGGVLVQGVGTENAWVAPSAAWIMAYALGSFLKTQRRLSNPGMMTSYYPPFWTMYNSLPKPDLKRKPKDNGENDDRAKRRRVIAQGVYGELPPDAFTGEDL